MKNTEGKKSKITLNYKNDEEYRQTKELYHSELQESGTIQGETKELYHSELQESGTIQGETKELYHSELQEQC